jgi:hypothetical protein
MNSPQAPNSRDQIQGSETATVSRRTFVIRSVALVAALVGFALVDFAVQTRTATDQSLPALVGTTAVSVPGFRNDVEPLASSAIEYYVPGPYTYQAKARYRNSAGNLEVQLAPTAAEYYYPAQPAKQAESNDGNVMTYEHD